MEAICLNCDEKFTYGYSSTGKFCGQSCMGEYKKNEHKKKWYAGLLEVRIDPVTLRKYLIEDRGYACEICNISDWQGAKLTLHGDHIDGNSQDSSPGNVRLLCPNCHSQTPTYGNKGRSKKNLCMSERNVKRRKRYHSS